ncbi:M48 family metalloprotease [Arenimonas composti]|uniref:Peptidase M48 domain-containing protein n=1 Tax=Arenimonas composti TR7-09 = DSM 18010 TaxID=1121013 RepID=A0A091BZ89_9GAMM|nr:M48 family metalloprotease [Arenimonas composti]KFN49690.1 hypothetical protein P873_09995 [Arenimonas composti TR7-09 = DSM 18010]
MPFAAFLRRFLLPVLLVAAATPERSAAVDGLVVVRADVEIVRGAGPLPSARDSERAVRHWPQAVAAALALPEPPVPWAPPPDPRDDPALEQALLRVDAIADALLPGPGEPRSRQPRLDIGADAAQALRQAMPGRLALFARLRAGGASPQAVALLLDLESGVVVARRALSRPGGDPARAADLERLARQLLRGFPLAGVTAARLPGAPATALPEADVDADLDRAVARFERQLLAHPGREDDADLHAYLRGIACRLAPERCDTLRLHLLREPGFNAWSIPDALLVLRTGTLLRCRDEAEVAFVLAHELAHARRGDARERWRRGEAGGDPQAGDPAIERRADADALAMLAAAGYPPAAGLRLWSRLVVEADAAPVPAARTHPPQRERVAELRARLGTSDVDVDAGDAGAARWLAVLAPFHARWLATEVAFGRPEVTAAMLAGAADAADTADTEAASGIAGSEAAARRALAGDGNALAAVLAAMDAAEAVADQERHEVPAVSAPRQRRVFGLRLLTRQDWARQPGAGFEQWTRHGLPLDRLLIVSGVDAGEALLHDARPGARRWRPGRGRAGLQLDLAAALHDAGWREIRYAAADPWSAAGESGWRAGIRLAGTNGLRHRGLVAAGEQAGRLVLLLWIAPEPWYHAEATATAALLEGARFTR